MKVLRHKRFNTTFCLDEGVRKTVYSFIQGLFRAEEANCQDLNHFREANKEESDLFFRLKR